MKILLNTLILLSFTSCSILYKNVGGDFKGKPSELNRKLGPKGKQMVAELINELKGKELMDFHTHLVGLGTNNSGAYVNSKMQSFWSPINSLKFNVYKSAGGIRDLDKADTQYIERLVDLARNLPSQLKSKFLLLAFDKHYQKDGSINEEHTEFYTPNKYVFEITKKYPGLFVPAISIHPYRKDAIERLEYWHKKGAKFIKWLPNAMGIDASNKMIIPYYKKVKELDMVILTHVGEEKAVEADEYQRLGNPLLFRLPLDMGVTIIMSHLASLGKNMDLDAKDNRLANNFDLFLRLMGEKKYEKNLYGEISALLQYNRFKKNLDTILDRQDLHHRLLNGSDYPLPAINFIIQTGSLVSEKNLTEEERVALGQVYQYNPLLFDLLLKRTIKHSKNNKKFKTSIFTNPFN